MKIIVNAIPLVNVNTGIGRYLKNLYTAIEKQYSHSRGNGYGKGCYGDVEISYFDGTRLCSSPPSGPDNLKSWSRVVDLFWKLPPSLACAVRRVFQIKRDFLFYKLSKGFDIYHEAGFFPLKVSPGVKTVFTVHDLSVQRFPHYHPAERVLFFNRYFWKRIKAVDAFIAVSHFTKNEMVEYLKIQESSISVTQLSHSSRNFTPQPPAIVQKVRKKYNLPELFFLFVGSGDPIKNLEIIPPAIEMSGLDIPLAVVGWSGWLGEKFQNSVINLGYVQDKDLAALYSGAQAFILPSIYEGFGLPILEAMACHCPVITTKNASLPEVAGDAALYLESKFDIDCKDNLAIDCKDNLAIECKDNLVIDCKDKSDIYRRRSSNVYHRRNSNAYHRRNSNAYRRRSSNAYCNNICDSEIKELSYLLQNIVMNKVLRNDMIQKGKKRLAAFSWDFTAKRTMRVFQEVMKKQGEMAKKGFDCADKTDEK